MHAIHDTNHLQACLWAFLLVYGEICNIFITSTLLIIGGLLEVHRVGLGKECCGINRGVLIVNVGQPVGGEIPKLHVLGEGFTKHTCGGLLGLHIKCSSAPCLLKCSGEKIGKHGFSCGALIPVDIFETGGIKSVCQTLESGFIEIDDSANKK